MDIAAWARSIAEEVLQEATTNARYPRPGSGRGQYAWERARHHRVRHHRKGLSHRTSDPHFKGPHKPKPKRPTSVFGRSSYSAKPTRKFSSFSAQRGPTAKPGVFVRRRSDGSYIKYKQVKGGALKRIGAGGANRKRASAYARAAKAAGIKPRVFGAKKKGSGRSKRA